MFNISHGIQFLGGGENLNSSFLRNWMGLYVQTWNLFSEKWLSNAVKDGKGVENI